MSKRRKEILKRNLKNKRLIIFIAVFVVLVFGFGIFWASYQSYLAKTSLESFIADDLISLIKIDINRDSEQNEKLKQIGSRLGNEKYFSDFLKSLVLQGVRPEDLKIDEDLFLGWLDNGIAIGNIRITPDKNSKIFILKIKNHDLLKDFLFTFEDNLGGKGYVIEKERFRDEEIVQIKKNKTISFTMMKGYLLISDFPDGLKKMIDTKLGRNKSIAFNKQYKRARGKLKNNEGIIFAYGDVLELGQTFLQMTESVDERIMENLENLDKKYYAAAKFMALEDSILAKIYLPKIGQAAKAKKIKSLFGNEVGSKTAFYSEGSSLKPLLLNLIAGESNDPAASFELISRGAKLEYGINLVDIIDILDSQYAVYVTPEFINNKIKLAFLVNIEDKNDVKEKIHSLEKAAGNLLGKYVTDGQAVNFVDKKYNRINYRIAVLPKLNFDLGYFIDSKKLVIFSNEKILDDLNSDKALSDETEFQELSKNKAEQIFYINARDLLKLSANLGETKFNVESLGRVAKSLGAIRVTKNRKWSGDFIEAYLSIK